MKADVDNDLLMLYHKDGQSKKAVIPVRDLIVAANYFAGAVAGSYSTVVMKYHKNLPDNIIVYGDRTGRRYKFIGDKVTNPDNDIYNDQGVSDNWVDVDRVANLSLISKVERLEAKLDELSKRLQT